MNEITSITTSVTNMMSTSVCVEWRTTPAEFGSCVETKIIKSASPLSSLTQVPTV